MSSNNPSNVPPYPFEEKSRNQMLKEGGYDDMQRFMNSHNLRMHNDDDVQEAKEILRHFDEYDRVYTKDGLPKNEQPSTTEDFDSDPDSLYGVPVSYYETDDDEDDEDDDENGCRIDGDHTHFEWGVDEPEFEGYPTFSDDEEGYGLNSGGYDEPDYGDDGDYENEGDDGDDW